MKTNFDENKPNHLFTMTAGAYLPFAQAVISGIFTSLVVLTMALYLRVREPWVWAVLSGAGVVLIVWFVAQWRWFSLTKLEKMTGIDWNGNGYIDDEPTHQSDERRVVTVDVREVSENGSLKITTARFTASEAQMETLALGLLGGRPFSRREWAGPGKLFTFEQFQSIQNELFKRGCIEMVRPGSPTLGFRLTRAGRAVMRNLSGDTPLPH